jgi:hypothetical protein
MPFREAALRVPGRVPLGGVPRARTRATRNRIRINPLKSLDSRLREQVGTGNVQVGGDLRHRLGPECGWGKCSYFVLRAHEFKSRCAKSESGRDQRAFQRCRSARAMFGVRYRGRGPLLPLNGHCRWNWARVRLGSKPPFVRHIGSGSVEP